LAFLVLISAPTAYAGIFDLYGLGPLGVAAAGAQTATTRAGAAAFYNPARLTADKRPSISIAASGVFPDFYVETAPNSPRPAKLPQANVGAVFTAVSPLGERWDNPFAIGLAGFVPLHRFTRIDAVDPATPHFPLHEELPSRLTLVASAGWEVVDGVRIGAGGQLRVALAGRANFSLDTQQRRVVRRTIDTDLDASLAPILAAAWEPLDFLSVGLTWRGAVSIDYSLPIDIQFQDAGSVEIAIDGTSLYTPASASLGVGLHLGAWTLSADLQLLLWSAAPSPAAHFSALVNFDELDPDASDDSALNFETVEVQPGWRDVLVPRVGVRFAPEQTRQWQWSVTSGYAFRPSPIPSQVGYSSYLDSATHQIGFGAALGTGEHELQLSTGANILINRDTTKDPNRDSIGTGDLSAGGSVWTVVMGYTKTY
jgi:long-subunit fatty acid transport protein